MPKTPYYRTDGTGRDMYIAYDNGGSFQPMMSIQKYDKISFRPKSAVAKSNVRSLHYVSNGSGRDSYIRITDGGLHAASTPQHYITSFTTSLRSYQPSKNCCDLFTWAQSNWKTNKNRSKSRSSSRKAQECITRLYKNN